MSTLFVNNEAKIEQWFPKPIYLLDNFCSDKIEHMDIWLSEMFMFNNDFKRTPELNVNSTHNEVNLEKEEFFGEFIRLLTRPPFLRLHRRLLGSLSQISISCMICLPTQKKRVDPGVPRHARA
jgi:hypothetical protein